MEVLEKYLFQSQMLGREKSLLSWFYKCSYGGKKIQTSKHFWKYLNIIVHVWLQVCSSLLEVQYPECELLSRWETDNVFKVLVLQEYAGRCLVLVRNIRGRLKEIWDPEKNSVGFYPIGSCIALYHFLIWKYSERVKGKARFEVHYWLLLYEKFSRCIWTLPMNFNRMQCENLKKTH